MIKRILLTVLCVFAAKLSAIAQENANNSADQIKAKLNSWEESFNKRNLTNFGDFYAEGYVGVYPNQPDQTYASTLNEYDRLFQNTFLTIKLKYEIVEIEAGNDFGFTRIIETSEVKPKFATKPQYAQDTGILIWKKQSNGEWKIYRSSLFPLVKEKEK